MLLFFQEVADDTDANPISQTRNGVFFLKAVNKSRSLKEEIMRRFALIVMLTLVGAILLVQPSIASGATRFASPDGSGTACSQPAPCSLNTALSQSVDDDTVYARWGVYTGTTDPFISFGNNITLIGRWEGGTGPGVGRLLQADATVLDGEDQRRVIQIFNKTCTLDGITVQGGLKSEGAGIYVGGGATVILNDVIVRNNIANGGWGGGLLVEYSTLLIQHSQILNNSSTLHEGGGVAVAWDSQVTLHNNLIANNTAGTSGAGVRLRDVTATLTNNTIVGGQGEGADGIYASEEYGETTLTVTNNIITGQAYGMRINDTMIDPVSATISYNNVWGNTTANYSGLTDPTGTNGNISLDPLFVSGHSRWVRGWAYPGFYLSQTAAGQVTDSPAVDAGSGSTSQMNLAARTTRSDSRPDSGVVDMGFHYPPFYPIFLPITIKQGSQ
jgi:hypothetical protein